MRCKLFSLVLLIVHAGLSSAYAQSFSGISPPIRPTSNQQCIQYQVDSSRLLLALEENRRRCEQREASSAQGVSICSAGIKLQYCGGRQQAYCTCATLSDEWCRVQAETAAASADCYKDVAENGRKIQEKRSPTPKGEKLAEVIRNIPETGKYIRFTYEVARPESNIRYPKNPPITLNKIATDIYSRWLWKTIPDMESVFVATTSREGLRELAISKALSSNMRYIQGVFAEWQGGPRSEAQVLSGSLTTRALSDYYGLNRGALDELDLMLHQSASSRPPGDDQAVNEGGSIGR